MRSTIRILTMCVLMIFLKHLFVSTVTNFLNTNPALKLVKKCFYRNVDQLKPCQQTLENSTWIMSFSEFDLNLHL